MKNFLKKQIKSIFNQLGFNLIIKNNQEFGYNLNDDVIRLLKNVSKENQRPIIFDVGSNVGQSIAMYKGYFPQSTIHSFEPGKVYNELISRTSGFKGIVYNNAGVGAQSGKATFLNNELSDMSSFLQPGQEIWSDGITESSIPLIAIDDYMTQHSISHIDLLKSDAQGFDFEVLKGASLAMKSGKISLIQLEIILGDLYHDLPSIDEIIRYLLDHDYKLVAFYGFHNKHIVSQWTDGLFIHKSVVPTHAN